MAGEKQRQGGTVTRRNLCYLSEPSLAQESLQSLFFHCYRCITHNKNKIYIFGKHFVKKPGFAMERGAISSPLETNMRSLLCLSSLCNMSFSYWYDERWIKDSNFSSEHAWPLPTNWLWTLTFVPCSSGHAAWMKEEMTEGTGTGRAYRFLALALFMKSLALWQCF